MPIAMVLMAGAGAAGVWPKVERDGWLSIVPTRVLIWAAFSDSIGDKKAVRDELNYHRFASYSLPRWQRSWIVSGLIERLATERDRTNRDFIMTLLAWVGGRDSKITPTLLAQIHDPHPRLRWRAVHNLGMYDADPVQTIGPLVAVLQDPGEDPEVRSEVCGVLMGYGARGKAAVPALLVAIKDANGDVRAAAVETIGHLGVDAKLVLPELEMPTTPPPSFAWDTQTALWGAVVNALGRYPEAAKTSVPILLDQLTKTKDATLRNDLVTSLGLLGVAAAGAASVLETIANDPNEHETTVELSRAALAVVRGQEPHLGIALAHESQDPDSPSRITAANQLWRLRTDGAPALEIVLKQLDTEMDPDVLRYLCMAISEMRSLPDGSLAALRRLRDRWPDGQADYAIGVIERREFGGPRRR